MPKVKVDSKYSYKQRLLEKAAVLPSAPGCYLMKNEKDVVLYVGKAKNLKKRVQSYFNESVKSPKTQFLLGHVTDFDFMMAGSEAEAFVLENNLIKKLAPKYNIRLKDDKSYPYLVVNMSEEFPRPEYQRRPKRGHNTLIFGPFTTGSNISEVLRILIRSFNLRDCSLREFKSRKTPCLLYQMKQCSAPCVGYIGGQDYQKDLQLALNFFRGKGRESVAVLKERMNEAAKNEEFEYAAILRDNIGLLEDFLERTTQKDAERHEELKDVDVVAYFEGEEEVDISIYMLRNGLLLGHKNFHFLSSDSLDDLDDSIINYLLQYYSSTNETLPEKIVTSFTAETMATFAEAINQALESKVKVVAPGRKFQSLFELALKHARESQRIRRENQESVYLALNKLKDLLSLRERPRVLECVDVAIWQGRSPTASQIVFHDGRPDKRAYRYYHLTERPEGNNDFAMMEEYMDRRLQQKGLPDVLIVDGGKGQVSAVQKVLNEKGLSLPVVGLAKAKVLNSQGTGTRSAKEVIKSDERLIIPNRVNPYILSKSPALFRLLVQMRDEAHRFSRKLHHKQEKRRLLGSFLDHVPGIGEETKKNILKKMEHGINELSEKTVDELQRMFELTERQAQAFYQHLQSSLEGPSRAE